MTAPNIQETLVDTQTGRLTLEGYKMIADLDGRIASAEAKLAAIAAVVAPAGGATIDAEARAAIAAILAAAA